MNPSNNYQSSYVPSQHDNQQHGYNQQQYYEQEPQPSSSQSELYGQQPQASGSQDQLYGSQQPQSSGYYTQPDEQYAQPYSYEYQENFNGYVPNLPSTSNQGQRHQQAMNGIIWPQVKYSNPGERFDDSSFSESNPGEYFGHLESQLLYIENSSVINYDFVSKVIANMRLDLKVLKRNQGVMDLKVKVLESDLKKQDIELRNKSQLIDTLNARIKFQADEVLAFGRLHSMERHKRFQLEGVSQGQRRYIHELEEELDKQQLKELFGSLSDLSDDTDTTPGPRSS